MSQNEGKETDESEVSEHTAIAGENISMSFASLETENDNSESEPLSEFQEVSLNRIIRARRNRMILDALLQIIEHNERSILDHVIDQSYHESLVISTTNMNRNIHSTTRSYGSLTTSDTACMICQENFADSDEIPTLSCGHVFHNNCLNEWVKRNPVCPFCQVAIPTCEQSTGRKRARQNNEEEQAS